MEAKIVKPDDIAAITFDSNTLIILEDNEEFGDPNVLQRIAAEDDKACPTILSLPITPVGDNSNYRRMLKQYFSPKGYELLLRLQINRTKEKRLLKWDPQGRQRHVAYCALNDVNVTISSGKTILVKEKSIIFCTPDYPNIIVSPTVSGEEFTVVSILAKAKN